MIFCKNEFCPKLAAFFNKGLNLEVSDLPAGRQARNDATSASACPINYSSKTIKNLSGP